MKLYFAFAAAALTLSAGALAANMTQPGHGSQRPSTSTAVMGAQDPLKSVVSPSIELTGYDPSLTLPINVCASATAPADFSMADLWTSSVPANSDSDLWQMLVPGVGVVASLAENDVGYSSPALNVVDTYGVGKSDISVPYAVAANTVVTYRMTTWGNNTSTGTPSFVSEMDVNCTTGAVLAFRNGAGVVAVQAVPVGGPAFLLMAAALLVLSGLWVSRRRN